MNWLSEIWTGKTKTRSRQRKCKHQLTSAKITDNDLDMIPYCDLLCMAFHRSAADAADSALWWNLQRGEVWQSEPAGYRQQSADGHQRHSRRRPAIHTCTHPVSWTRFFFLIVTVIVIPAVSPSAILFFNVLYMSHLPGFGGTVINWFSPLTGWIFIEWRFRCFWQKKIIRFSVNRTIEQLMTSDHVSFAYQCSTVPGRGNDFSSVCIR